MHLHHPALSLNGKRKGKVKFRSAEAARRARECAEAWQQLLENHGQTAKKPKKQKTFEPYRPRPNTNVRDTGPRPPSLNPTDMTPAFKSDSKVYTGNKMIGLGTMHKSNTVPIFSDDEARDIAHMRR